MNYKVYNDYELIYMVRENNDTYDLLYEKYNPIIRKLSYNYYIRFKDYGYDYDDFLQESNIAFQRAIMKYDDEKDSLFYTFAVVCIKRSLITFCRNISNDRKNIANTFYVDYEDCLVEDIRENISGIFNEKEISSLLKDIILELDIEKSSIFELKLNGFSYREISCLLDIPTSTVEYKYRKIRQYIKKLICKYNREKTV